jgi:hypothetical protein
MHGGYTNQELKCLSGIVFFEAKHRSTVIVYNLIRFPAPKNQFRIYKIKAPYFLNTELLPNLIRRRKLLIAEMEISQKLV